MLRPASCTAYICFLTLHLSIIKVLTPCSFMLPYPLIIEFLIRVLISHAQTTCYPAQIISLSAVPSWFLWSWLSSLTSLILQSSLGLSCALFP
ncbi:hypothetical protein EDB92DRAFT_1824234, partial [Lactarius akahatsu]